MASAPKANAVVGQSGGPTAVINASLVGVIEEAKKHPEIQTIYGAVHAVAGMVKDEFIDLGKLSAQTLETVAASPSSSLGSSRDKPDAAYCRRILDVFKKRNIRYFFYIGGNDSANTALHRQHGGPGGRLRHAGVPRAQDRGQRPARDGPLPRLRQCRQVRRLCPDGRRSGQPGSARREDRRHHGPQRRLPDRRRRPGTEARR